MMFGLREQFEYTQCGTCGSLQIVNPPSDYAKYYPKDYLAFAFDNVNEIKQFLKTTRFKYSYYSKGLFGKLLQKFWWSPEIGKLISQTKTNLTDSVLDVGSGEGELLFQMYKIGFSNLTGVDPYIRSDKQPFPGLKFIKSNLSKIKEKYDLIMFNHSLEHVLNPRTELLHAVQLLNPGKCILVRLPIAGGFAFRKYGTDWVQWDSPRHVSIPTEKGMRVLAADLGLTVENVIYESWAFQFWGSEQILKDIPLHDKRSLWLNSKSDIFTKEQLKHYTQESIRLNKENDGDMACFILRKEK